MGIVEILSIIMAIAGYFVSKKNGATDTQAALVAAGAGFGTYYVAKNTAWGQDVVGSIDSVWNKVYDSAGNPVKNGNGEDVYIPPNSEPDTNSDGTYKTDASGNIIWKLLDTTGSVVSTTGSVLESWGAAGTAAVIGTVAAVNGNNNVLLYAGLAVGALLLLK